MEYGRFIEAIALKTNQIRDKIIHLTDYDVTNDGPDFIGRFY